MPGPGHQFQKGVSGNPGGRPKETPEMKDAKDKARKLCPKAVDRLAQLMDSANEQVAAAAANSILDRGLGRPVQAIVGGDDESNPIRTVTRIELVDLDRNSGSLPDSNDPATDSRPSPPTT